MQRHLPTWSPDGSQIAFYSERDGYTEIFVIDVLGTHERQLTKNSVNDKDPAWSPDGTRIAFRSNRGGYVDVYRRDRPG